MKHYRCPRARHLADRWVSLLCGVLFMGIPVASVRAAGDDEAAARALFAKARKLVDGGNYAEACPLFGESLRLDPGIGTSFNLADCQEHTGLAASAWVRFLDVAAATRAAGQVERERVARARALAIQPRLTHLVVQVKDPAPGLVVKRDGLEIGHDSWGVAIPVDPGKHLLEATAPARKGWSRTATVPHGPARVTVTVPALATEEITPGVRQPADEQQHPRPEPVSVLGGADQERPHASDALFVDYGIAGRGTTSTLVRPELGLTFRHSWARWSLAPRISYNEVSVEDVDLTYRLRRLTGTAYLLRRLATGAVRFDVGVGASLTHALQRVYGGRELTALVPGMMMVGSLEHSLTTWLAARLIGDAGVELVSVDGMKKLRPAFRVVFGLGIQR